MPWPLIPQPPYGEIAAMDKDLWRLELLHRYATELHALITDAESAAPDQVQARDGSGAIRMTIGPDAMPVTLQIVADWKRRLQPGAVGEAVIDAYAACVRRWTAEWTRILEDHGFHERIRRLDRLEADAFDPPPPPTGGSLPPRSGRTWSKSEPGRPI